MKIKTLTALAAIVPAAAASAQAITTQTIATGLTRPINVIAPEGDFGRIFVIEQQVFDSASPTNRFGRIRVIDLATQTVLPTPFFQIPVSGGNEQGLLGLVFHPDYANNGYLYINYTDGSGTTRVDRITVNASNPNLADDASRIPVLSIAQPFSNHNGGWMGFGPNDGYLYISTGDGGSGGDPGNRSQDITNQLLGKMLRIDVDGDDFPADFTRNYAIPADNPFVGVTGDDEIWAYGLRNAWRCSFDPTNGDLYIADVGQNAREEVSFQPGDSAGGENYGWRCYEGNAVFNTTGCPPMSELVFPIVDYSHASGRCSITGGEIYRGCAIPELSGTYFYSDFCSNDYWSLRYDGTTVTEFTDRDGVFAGAGSNPVSFGRDAFGEVYVTTFNGRVSKIVPTAGFDDCNGNAIADQCEIDFGLATDVDGNGQPDSCQQCSAADLSPDFGVLNIDDVLVFLDAFAAGTPAADLAAPSGTFNIDDVLAYIDAFAAGCP